MAKAIPDKEGTTVARGVYEKLILEHGSPEILLSDNGKEFANDTLAYVCEEFCIEHFTSPYPPRSSGKTENFNKFLKASIRKLTSKDKATWDQVLDQILFAYRCHPHTSTGEAPYTLIYARDPPLPIQNLIKVVVPYKGGNELGRRIQQSRVSLSIAAKWLSKMRDRQKRHYLNKRSIHPFKVGDLVLLKKQQGDKMDLKWVPNYRVIIKLTSAWSAIVENQTTGKTKMCNVGEPKLKYPSEDWQLKPYSVGRAAKFINHPDNLPDIDPIPNHDKSPDKSDAGTKCNLRKNIKGSTKLDL